MRFLFDTHIVLSLLRDELERDYPFATPLLQDRSRCVISVATLWEIAIKVRLGKLACLIKVEELDVYLPEAGFTLLPITPTHATILITPDIPTRDPFDRLLVAVAQSEGMRLVSADRALFDRPVTFR